MKITREDRNNALKALGNAYCVAMRVFQACPDEDALTAWTLMCNIEDMQQYISEAELVNGYSAAPDVIRNISELQQALEEGGLIRDFT